MLLLSWIDLTADLLHISSLLLLSFFCTNVSSLDHMPLSCHLSISAKYKYDRSIACRPVPTRFEPWCVCSKRWSRTDIVGGATLERPSAKIRSRNLWRWAFRENWILWKFPAIRYEDIWERGFSSFSHHPQSEAYILKHSATYELPIMSLKSSSYSSDMKNNKYKTIE